MKKKILIVTNMYPTTSKPQWGMFVYEQVMSLKKNFNDDLDIDVFHIDGSISKFLYLKAMFTLPGYIKKNGYHLVHVHYGLTLVSTIFVTVPIIVTFHGSDLLKSPVKYLSRLLGKKTSKIIVVSSSLRREIDDGVIIPCGINFDNFKIRPISSDSKILGEKNKIKLLFPSDPNVKVKNYPLFLKVCEVLRAGGLAVEEIFLRNIPRGKVPEIFWQCDLMLLTSFSEGSPTVVKEAIAAKLPFVSVDVGDVEDWLEAIDFGVVVKNRDPFEIARQVVDLLGSIKNRSNLDNSKTLKKMDIDEVSREIYHVYDEILLKQALVSE